MRWFFILLAIPLLDAAAEARPVSCELPAASFCPGCVKKTTVVVQPDGTCRIKYLLDQSRFRERTISIRSEIAAETKGSAKATDPEEASMVPPMSVEIEIEADRAPPRRTSPRRARAPMLPRVRTSGLGALQAGRCFMFSGRRFCE